MILPVELLPYMHVPCESTSNNATHRSTFLFRREEIPDPDTWYLLKSVAAGSTNCLSTLLNVDGSVEYPVRFHGCDTVTDDALWRLDKDGGGRYFIYNKAWPGNGDRLDIHRQTSTLYIMWMGPSGDQYNNQRWSLTPTNDALHISSMGLPGFLMASGERNGKMVAFMQDGSVAGDQAVLWNLVDPSSSDPSSDPPPQASPQPSARASALPSPRPSSPTADSSTLTGFFTDFEDSSSTTTSTTSLFAEASLLPTTTSISPSSTSMPTETTALSRGAIAGIAGGSLLGLLIAVAIFFFCRHRRRGDGNALVGPQSNPGIGLPHSSDTHGPAEASQSVATPVGESQQHIRDFNFQHSDNASVIGNVHNAATTNNSQVVIINPMTTN